MGSIAHLREAIYQARDQVLRDCMEEGKEKMREYVQTYWYGQYSPVSYARTQDFIDSVDARWEGNTIVFFYNTSKIGSSPNPGGWGAHSSFDGSPFNDDGFIEMVENGMGGGSPNNPRFGDDGAHAVKRLRGYLANYVTRAVQGRFGFHVKVRKT